MRRRPARRWPHRSPGPGCPPRGTGRGTAVRGPARPAATGAPGTVGDLAADAARREPVASGSMGIAGGVHRGRVGRGTAAHSVEAGAASAAQGAVRPAPGAGLDAASVVGSAGTRRGRPAGGCGTGGRGTVAAHAVPRGRDQGQKLDTGAQIKAARCRTGGPAGPVRDASAGPAEDELVERESTAGRAGHRVGQADRGTAAGRLDPWRRGRGGDATAGSSAPPRVSAASAASATFPNTAGTSASPTGAS